MESTLNGLPHKPFVISMEQEEEFDEENMMDDDYDDDVHERARIIPQDAEEAALLAEQEHFMQSRQAPSAKVRPSKKRKERDPPSSAGPSAGIGIGFPDVNSLPIEAFTGVILEKNVSSTIDHNSFKPVQPPSFRTTPFPHVPHRSERATPFGRVKTSPSSASPSTTSISKPTPTPTPTSTSSSIPSQLPSGEIVVDPQTHETKYVLPATELEKLQWIWRGKTPSSTSASSKTPPDIITTKPSNQTLRFHFNGIPINPSKAEEIPTHLGLHHHGDEPEAPGYTIIELFTLARSNVAAQRTAALQTITSIVLNSDTERLLFLIEMSAPLVLRSAIDDQNVSALSWGVRALHALLIRPGGNLKKSSHPEEINSTEEWFTESEGYHQGHLLLSLAPQHKGRETPKLQMSADTSAEGEKPSTISQDFEVTKQDLVYGLSRMLLFPRIRYLLDLKPLREVGPLLLDILIRCARHSKTVAYGIVDCPGLIETLKRTFLETSTPALESSIQSAQVTAANIFGSNVNWRALRLIRALCQSGGKTLTEELMLNQQVLELILRFVAVPIWTDSDCKYVVEALRTLRVIAAYGIESETITDVFPRLIQMLSTIVQKEQEGGDNRKARLAIGSAIWEFLDVFVYYASSITGSTDSSPSSTWAALPPFLQPTYFLLDFLSTSSHPPSTDLQKFVSSALHFLASYLNCASERQEAVSITTEQLQHILSNHLYPFVNSTFIRELLSKPVFGPTLQKTKKTSTSLSNLPELVLTTSQTSSPCARWNLLNGIFRVATNLLETSPSLIDDAKTRHFFSLALQLIQELISDTTTTSSSYSTSPTVLYQLHSRTLLGSTLLRLLHKFNARETLANPLPFSFAFLLLEQLLPGDESTLVYLLRSIIFSQEGLQHFASSKENVPMLLMKFSELYVNQLCPQKALMESLSLTKPQPLSMKTANLLLPFEVSRLVPLAPDWLLSIPLFILSDIMKRQKHEEGRRMDMEEGFGGGSGNNEEAISFVYSALEMVRLFLQRSPVNLRVAFSLSPSSLCCGLMRVFLEGNELFFEEKIGSLLHQLLVEGVAPLAVSSSSDNQGKNKKWKRSERRVERLGGREEEETTNAGTPLSIARHLRLCSSNLEKAMRGRFYSLIKDFISHFANVSFGNKTFAQYVFLFLRMSSEFNGTTEEEQEGEQEREEEGQEATKQKGPGIHYRKLIWSELLDLLHFLKADPMIDLHGYLFPLEEEEELLSNFFLEALSKGKLTPERNDLLYWIVIHHLSAWLFEPGSEDFSILKEKRVVNTRWNRKIALKNAIASLSKGTFLTLLNYFTHQPELFPPSVSELCPSSSASSSSLSDLPSLRDYLVKVSIEFNLREKLLALFEDWKELPLTTVDKELGKKVESMILQS